MVYTIQATASTIDGEGLHSTARETMNMGHFRFRFDCVRPECREEPGTEAQVQECGDNNILACGLCDNRRPFPKDWFSRENPGLIADTVRDLFKVGVRYVN